METQNTNHTTIPNNMKLIITHEPYLSSISFDSIKPQNSNFSFQSEIINLPCPSKNTFFGPRVVGSCMGLLCLNFPDCCILWNPKTKTHHKMPEPDVDSDFQERKNWRSYVVHGLGYDQINDDYKVIRVYQYLGPDNFANRFDSKVLVYSLKSNSWKRVDDFPYFVDPGTMMNDVFVNGAFHFKVSKKEKGVVDSGCMIVAFDVSRESYNVVMRLACGGKMKYDVELGVLGECLCLVRNFDVGISQFFVMKEYGVGSSWTELFRIRKDDGALGFKVISYFGNEKQVLLESGGEILCFDIESKTFKDIEIIGIDEDFEIVCVCMENEVVLGSVDGTEKEKIKVDEKNIDGVDGNEHKMEVDEKSVGSVDGNEDKMKVYEKSVDEKSVGSVDDNEDKMKVDLKSVEDVSTERELCANEERTEPKGN